MNRTPKPIGKGKLTHEFHMSLRVGVYLVSNLCQTELVSAFEEYVVPEEFKPAQWLRITAVHAQGRNCWVFDDRETYRKWLKGFVL